MSNSVFGSHGVIYGSMLERVGLLYQAISSIRHGIILEKIFGKIYVVGKTLLLCAFLSYSGFAVTSGQVWYIL